MTWLIAVFQVTLMIIFCYYCAWSISALMEAVWAKKFTFGAFLGVLTIVFFIWTMVWTTHEAVVQGVL